VPRGHSCNQSTPFSESVFPRPERARRYYTPHSRGTIHIHGADIGELINKLRSISAFPKTLVRRELEACAFLAQLNGVHADSNAVGHREITIWTDARQFIAA
jgi:hypothetical protein